ncbi:hypothetical protein [Mesorhizobium sp. B2-5-11]|uniref:hypothetical protein n=1 Tax=Mesorhizobium sp. B2-5-11 TaxID=2589919 RepID=UPI001127E197|nr:hypothetical protein [Mesorhizobium sp. B2-5-11]TPK14142.1 hypothetical protein FJ490_02130 [Mesorhizobium sp. B2-5-11]
MKPRHSLTPEQKKEAGTLFKAGWTYLRIGEKLRCHYQTVKRALDPEYASCRSEQARHCRRKRAKGAKPVNPKREHALSIDVKADAAARLSEIPPDTRSLTGRMFGDPIPGDTRRERFNHG